MYTHTYVHTYTHTYTHTHIHTHTHTHTHSHTHTMGGREREGCQVGASGFPIVVNPPPPPHPTPPPPVLYSESLTRSQGTCRLRDGSTDVGWLLVVPTTTQSAPQGRICSHNFTCCHTEAEVTDRTDPLTQSQYRHRVNQS